MPPASSPRSTPPWRRQPADRTSSVLAVLAFRGRGAEVTVQSRPRLHRRNRGGRATAAAADERAAGLLHRQDFTPHPGVPAEGQEVPAHGQSPGSYGLRASCWSAVSLSR